MWSPKEYYLAVHTIQMAMLSGRFIIDLMSRYIQLCVSSGPTHTLIILLSRIIVSFQHIHVDKWPLLLHSYPCCTHSWCKISDWTFIMVKEFSTVHHCFIMTRKLEVAIITTIIQKYEARWLRNTWHVLNAPPPATKWNLCRLVAKVNVHGPRGEMGSLLWWRKMRWMWYAQYYGELNHMSWLNRPQQDVEFVRLADEVGMSKRRNLSNFSASASALTTTAPPCSGRPCTLSREGPVCATGVAVSCSQFCSTMVM